MANIYQKLGVTTSFDPDKQEITLAQTIKPLGHLELDLIDTPDIAQTIAVTCFGKGIGCDLSGLHTLKIKETDRLYALKTEIEKFGGTISITGDSLHLATTTSIKENVAVSTYNDHRMAMAFAPLALKVPLIIEDAMVVSKSYPSFWEDLEAIGFKIIK